MKSSGSDYLGAALIGGAASALLLMADWGGKQYGWGSPTISGLAVIGGLLLIGFGWRQATAAEPIIPLSLFRNGVFRVTSLLQLITGFALTGSIVYIVVYLQIARGVDATMAGLRLLPMAVGLVLASIVGGALIAKLGRVKGLLIFGTAFAALGLGLLGQLHTDTSMWLISLDMFLLGAGLGQIVGLGLLVVQNAVHVRRLGVATTSIRFIQTLGGAIGSAAFGAILTREFAGNLPAGMADHASRSGSGVAQLGSLPAGVKEVVINAFVKATDTVFLTATVVMVLAFVLAWFLKEKVMVDGQNGAATAETSSPEVSAEAASA